MSDTRVTTQQFLDDINRLRNTVPSRDAAEDVRRISLALDGDDAALLDRVAEFLLDARQVLRGGKRNVRGSRHWDVEQ